MTDQETFVHEGAVYAKEPIPGVTPGTILPLSEFPDELFCPFCDPEHKGKGFKTENALRGHAHSKHGIRWELPEKAPKPGAPNYALMVQPHDRTNLKPWHMIGLAMHDLYGLTWEEVGDKLGKGHTVLCSIGGSPAGTAFRTRLMELAESPEAVALLLMKANSINVTADFFAALEWAKEARDYAAVHKMTKDLLTLAGAEERQKDDERVQTQELHIHLDAKDLAVPFVTSSLELMPAEVVDANGR
jgi:hypothetical protein